MIYSCASCGKQVEKISQLTVVEMPIWTDVEDELGNIFSTIYSEYIEVCQECHKEKFESFDSFS